MNAEVLQSPEWEQNAEKFLTALETLKGEFPNVICSSHSSSDNSNDESEIEFYTTEMLEELRTSPLWQGRRLAAQIEADMQRFGTASPEAAIVAKHRERDVLSTQRVAIWIEPRTIATTDTLKVIRDLDEIRDFMQQLFELIESLGGRVLTGTGFDESTYTPLHFNNIIFKTRKPGEETRPPSELETERRKEMGVTQRMFVVFRGD